MTDSEETAATTSARRRAGGRDTLDLRFVTRMSRALGDQIAVAARAQGLTAGAFVRRILLESVGMHSPSDARSGRPVHAPTEDVSAVSDAVRELASVNRAIALSDKAAAKAGLDRARELLIPVVMRRSGL